MNKNSLYYTNQKNNVLSSEIFTKYFLDDVNYLKRILDRIDIKNILDLDLNYIFNANPIRFLKYLPIDFINHTVLLSKDNLIKFVEVLLYYPNIINVNEDLVRILDNDIVFNIILKKLGYKIFIIRPCLNLFRKAYKCKFFNTMVCNEFNKFSVESKQALLDDGKLFYILNEHPHFLEHLDNNLVLKYLNKYKVTSLQNFILRNRDDITLLEHLITEIS